MRHRVRGHPSSRHAASQNIHSIRVHRTKLRVISHRTASVVPSASASTMAMARITDLANSSPP